VFGFFFLSDIYLYSTLIFILFLLSRDEYAVNYPEDSTA